MLTVRTKVTESAKAVSCGSVVFPKSAAFSSPVFWSCIPVVFVVAHPAEIIAAVVDVHELTNVCSAEAAEDSAAVRSLYLSTACNHHEVSMRPLVYERPTIDLSKVHDLENLCCFGGSVQCVVCLDTIDEGWDAVVSFCGGLSNAHCFHSKCLLEASRHVWENDLKSKCPICREPLEEQNLRCMNKPKLLAAVENCVFPMKKEFDEQEIMQVVKNFCRSVKVPKKVKTVTAKLMWGLQDTELNAILNDNIRMPLISGEDSAENTGTRQRETHNRPNLSKLSERLIHNHLLQLWRAEENARRARREERQRRKKKEKKKSKRRHNLPRKARNSEGGRV
ncbi:hypothetical protein QR680_009661 [Steinernema hermaphroditum]|uniref:RING-type domain-containing protein n=1 Tax=Steinernema hermaphroditum TaxID=289476 RepID=A0AA39MA56_9BILA|nr:hypothetical protein QR680_009661 [Steinernema hermaphroditum]